MLTFESCIYNVNSFPGFRAHTCSTLCSCCESLGLFSKKVFDVRVKLMGLHIMGCCRWSLNLYNPEYSLNLVWMIRCGAILINVLILFGLVLYEHKGLSGWKVRVFFCSWINGMSLFHRPVFVLSDSGYRGWQSKQGKWTFYYRGQRSSPTSGHHQISS